mmetsp:Transcript_10416/g.13266  ORF Transcript_10416/g.13266 Transcript_10416/m.13266 type:complete len:334 (-) Transcript_10416:120-1121(-)
MLSSCKSASSETPSLNRKNFANVSAYILNIIFTYGVGTAGFLGTPTNGDLSDKYQTIVTPNADAFRIWIVIFMFQLLFTVVQLLPKFRATRMVQDGVSYWYCLVCAMQIGWTFTFAYEIIPASLAFMLALYGSLMTLLYSQYYAESDNSLWEFWLLRFPFALHGGWITAASALNVNVQAVASSAPADIQLALAIVCLAVLHAISVWVLFYLQRPNWTIACVLAWAFGYIYQELASPNNLIIETFTLQTINGVRYAAFAVGAIIIPVQLAIRVAMLARPQFNPYRTAAADHSDNATQESSETKALTPAVDEGVVVTGATREEEVTKDGDALNMA